MYRRMRGEDLQGLDIEELQKLEMSLEAGLDRVIETKVWDLNTCFLYIL